MSDATDLRSRILQSIAAAEEAAAKAKVDVLSLVVLEPLVGVESATLTAIVARSIAGAGVGSIDSASTFVISVRRCLAECIRVGFVAGVGPDRYAITPLGLGWVMSATEPHVIPMSPGVN